MSEPAWQARAANALHGASVLLDAGDFAAAVSRAYYAMFYAARAALLAEGLATKTHSGLVHVFGQTFVQGGRVSAEAGKALREAFRARQLADYAEEEVFGREDAARYVEQARRFVAEVERLLGEDGR